MRKVLLLLLQCHLLMTPILAHERCPIYLTISLTGKSLHDATLEINWGLFCSYKPEWIGIFREDPSLSSLTPEVRINLDWFNGKKQTSAKLGELHFPGGWDREDSKQDVSVTSYPNGKCLPFYVASFNGTELLEIECLKIQPNWMENLKDAQDLPLRRLFLPGTHASGAYIANYNQTVSPMARDYVMTQQFDVWSQLVLGIRYLDLSVGYRTMDSEESNSKSDEFWLVNENMFMNPLAGILRDVRRFVELSNELVILDFGSFPIGFNHTEVYTKLFQLIREELEDVAYERNLTIDENCANLSFEDFRTAGRQVILLFRTEELPHPWNESTILCTPWKQFNTDNMRVGQWWRYAATLLLQDKEECPIKDEGWILHLLKSEDVFINRTLKTVKERSVFVNTWTIYFLNDGNGFFINVLAMNYFTTTN